MKTHSGNFSSISRYLFVLHLVVGGVWTTHYIKALYKVQAVGSGFYSIQNSPSSEADSFAARQEIPIQFTGPESLFLYSNSPVTIVYHKL
jgi:hypothetical protein